MRKILILGNELSLGEPLKEAFEQKGHQVFYVLSPDEATNTLSSNRIDIMFVDCMLPKKSGVDYIVDLKNGGTTIKSKIVLMSGIYTEKHFIQDSLKRTQAVAFIKKEEPFDYSQVFDILDKLEDNSQVKKEDTTPRKSLYQIFSKSKVSNREKRKVIESLDHVSGFDLPFIYSLLVETKSSGYLNIYRSDGSVSGISFAQGAIVGVDIEDRKTVLGELLIQSGYATPKDVQEAINDKSNLKFGQKLIRGNRISPHAFDLVLTEQMNIRLSRTIVDEKIKINFLATDVELTQPAIDSDLLLEYLHDWISSKISLNWLRSLYVMWSGNQIVKSSTYRTDHPALQLSLIKEVDGLLPIIEKGIAFGPLLDSNQFNPEMLHKAIHFLLTKGLIIFAKKLAAVNEEEQKSLLIKMWGELKDKSEFEILDHIGMGTMIGEISKESFHDEFLGLIGPEPSSQNAELNELWHKLRGLVEKSVDISENTSIRIEMKQAQDDKGAESKLAATQLVEEAKQFLLRSQHTAALEKLKKAMGLYPQTSFLRLYMAWAKVGLFNPDVPKIPLKDVEMELLQVPPEDRYDFSYAFVTGLLQKARQDYASAKKSFEKVIAMNPNFTPARKEIVTVESLLRAKQDILNMDLKKVVAGFFKRK